MLGYDFHRSIFPKCPMNKNDKINPHNYNNNNNNNQHGILILSSYRISNVGYYVGIIAVNLLIAAPINESSSNSI